MRLWRRRWYYRANRILCFSCRVSLRSAQRSLYYTRIEIGEPPKGYYVQVDTGSDILWVNCIRCEGCPTRSGLGVNTTWPCFHMLLIPLMILVLGENNWC